MDVKHVLIFGNSAVKLGNCQALRTVISTANVRPGDALSSGALLLLMMSLCVVLGWRVAASEVYGPRAAPLAAMWWPGSPRLGEFELTAQDGSPLRHDNLRGAWTLLFFGYTYCPDICPGTLALIARAHRSLAGGEAPIDPLKVLFVSVDAQRDSPAVLARYVRHFNPDFLGATAPMEGLHLLTRQLTADFARVGGDMPGEYWFDHSASIFLIAPDLRVVAEFTPPLDATELATQVRNIVRFISVHG